MEKTSFKREIKDRAGALKVSGSHTGYSDADQPKMTSWWDNRWGYTGQLRVGTGQVDGSVGLWHPQPEVILTG